MMTRPYFRAPFSFQLVDIVYYCSSPNGRGLRVYDPGTCLNFNARLDAFCGALLRPTIVHQFTDCRELRWRPGLLYGYTLSRYVVTGDRVSLNTFCSTALTLTPSIRTATPLYTSVHLMDRYL